MKTIIQLLILAYIITACQNNQTSQGHTHDVIGGQAAHDDHEHPAGSLSYTLFLEDYELFVEFPLLTVGHTSTFAAHFTQLSTYRPVSEGIVTVSLIKGGKGIRHRVDAPSSPGIFRPSLQPGEAGIYKLIFELGTGSGTHSFEIPEVRVYSSEVEASDLVPAEDSDEGVTFLKEQAWETEFATHEIAYQPFHTVLHTSARVKAQPNSAVVLNAQAAGEVNLMVVLGESVKKGDLLAMISGSGIETSLTQKLALRKIAFDKGKSDYIRTEPLSKNQAISQKDFLEIQTRYRQDSLNYYQLANVVSKNGLKVPAPFNGFVSHIEAENGQFVENGASLLTLNDPKRLLIEAYVNQTDYQKVSGIFDANFTLPGGNQTITLDEIGGTVASKNAFVNDHFARIPVVFSVRNRGDLMLGMFLEAYLLTGKKERALVVPLSALIEEHGQYYVFVQTGGESFTKRQVTISGNDVISAEIESGLIAGERIVTKGAYQIKLAAMAGDLPLHGHTH